MNKTLLLNVHVATYILIIFSPFFLAEKIQKKYGYLIAYLLFATITSWIVLGQCPLNKVQNTTKYRSVTTFLHNLGFNSKPYNSTIQFVARYLTFAATFYYSPSKKFTYATLILFVIYHIAKYISKDETIITGTIKELF